jgi:integrase
LNNDKKVSIKKRTSFWQIFDEFVEYKKRTVSNNVVKDYNNSLRKHLKIVERQLNRKLKFNDFRNQHNGFIDKFDFYLNNIATNSRGSNGLKTNTIGKQYKNIKAFLNYCFDKEIIDSFSLKHLVTVSEEPYNIYLTKEELELIKNLDIKDTALDEARNQFLILCNTGFRYGDLISLKPIHIQNKKIRKQTIKNGPIITIPINSVVDSILKKYNNELPKPINITNFNNNIRTIVEMAGINNKIEVNQTFGRVKSTEVIKKYEMATSHTGRRTFCTNLFLAGMPSEAIMIFSGHKTVKSFMRYLKLTSEITAMKYKDEFFK